MRRDISQAVGYSRTQQQRLRSWPGFSADSVELMFISVGIVVLAFQVIMYRRINAKRDKLLREQRGEGWVYTAEQLRDLGDKAVNFRYTL